MKPEITWTVCPTCDMKRPFLVEYEDTSGEWLPYFHCLGCGDVFDDEGIQISEIDPPAIWRRGRIRACYEYYREQHDQIRRDPQPEGD